MQVSVALLERDQVLGTFRDMLDHVDASHAGRLLLIEGAAGLGKTTVLSAIRQVAQSRGRQVARARGSELECDYPWSLARQLFESLLEGSGGVAITPASKLAYEFVLSGQQPDTPAGEYSEYSLIHSFSWLVCDLTAEADVALLIDDLHWADLASLRLLAYLAARLEELPFVIVAAARPAVERSRYLISLLVDSPTGDVRRLQPLSPEAAHLYLRALTGDGMARGIAERCEDLAQGNPFLLRELGRQIALSAAEHRDPDLLSTRFPEIERYVRLQLDRVSPYAMTVVQGLAVLEEGATADHVAAMVDLPVAEVLDLLSALQQGELVRSEDSPENFMMAHPIYSAAVYNTLPPNDRAELHIRAAEILLKGDDIEKAAAHLIRVPPGYPDFDVSPVLDKATALSLSRGAVDGAVAYLRRRLLDETGEARREILSRLAFAELMVDSAAATQHLTAALSLEQTAEERAELSLALAGVKFLASGHPGEAAEILATTLTRSSGLTISTERSLQAWLLLMTQLAPLSDSRRALAEELGRFESDPTAGGLMLDAVLALTHAHGNRRPEALRLALRATADESLLMHPLAESPLSCAWIALLACDAPQLPDRIDRAVSYAIKNGSLRSQLPSKTYRGALMLAQGHLEDARLDLQSSWEAAATYGAGATSYRFIGSYLLQTLVSQDKLAEADAVVKVIREADATMPRFVDGDGELEYLLARDRIDDAFTLVDVIERDCRAYGVRNPLQCDWQGYLIRCLHHRGRDEEAVQVAADYVARAHEWGTDRAVGRALRIASIAQPAATQLEMLCQSTTALLRSEARFELAQARIAYGDALRRARRFDDARSELQAGLEAAESCGSDGLKQQAVATLRMIGARPVVGTNLGVGALTPGELRVAELASKGLSNREIAQNLFVTVKTVELHLSKAFRKLGIARRRDLPGALGI